MAKLREIVVDNFAGGGGASTGIEIVTGNSYTNLEWVTDDENKAKRSEIIGKE